MSTLQLLWFVLIGILLSGFFFLEGFDFGIGMAAQMLAHNDNGKDRVVATVGPIWDGNEVWLLTAGGVMFASFPYWYASLFSGYYLILFTTLFGLVIRGVPFEFRHNISEGKRHRMWNWILSTNSFLMPFFFDILFINLAQGIPLDANGNMHAQFTGYSNLFSIIGGIALTLLCYLHGTNYIALKTEGPTRERAQNYAKILYGVLHIDLVVFAVLMYFKTDFYEKNFTVTLALTLATVVLTVIANVGVFKRKEMLAFLTSGLTLVILAAFLLSSLLPRVMVGNEGFNLLIKDATSTPYTLKIMTRISLSTLSFALAYTAWLYYISRKRIS